MKGEGSVWHNVWHSVWHNVNSTGVFWISNWDCTTSGYLKLFLVWNVSVTFITFLCSMKIITKGWGISIFEHNALAGVCVCVCVCVCVWCVWMGGLMVMAIWNKKLSNFKVHELSCTTKFIFCVPARVHLCRWSISRQP